MDKLKLSSVRASPRTRGEGGLQPATKPTVPPSSELSHRKQRATAAKERPADLLRPLDVPDGRTTSSSRIILSVKWASDRRGENGNASIIETHRGEEANHKLYHLSLFSYAS